MDRGNFPPLRALPRAFVSAVPEPCEEAFELPKEEFDKFHKVLRLGAGDQVAILPGDGRLIRCELHGRGVLPIETVSPQTESPIRLTVAIGLPRAETLEEAVRMATEMGAAEFLFFPAERSVVRWDKDKRAQKLSRLQKIAREAAEVSFRTRLPRMEWCESLKEVLQRCPDALVLSERETVQKAFVNDAEVVTIVIGPEGGWTPRESEWIGDRGMTLGPRVLRVDSAVAAACALVLLRYP